MLVDTLYYKYWYIVDLVIVGLHMGIVAVLALPIFIIFIMTKVSYAEYSLYNPDALLFLYILYNYNILALM